jgi:hypothetical protein
MGARKRVRSRLPRVMGMIEFLRPDIWMLENPMGRIKRMTGLPEPRLVFDPWHFGDPWTKRTQIFGEYNALLPQAFVEPRRGHTLFNLRGMCPSRSGRVRSRGGFALCLLYGEPDV